MTKRRLIVIVVAWWFLAWGEHENFYGNIAHIGPFDSREDCDAMRLVLSRPGNAIRVSAHCWYTRETVHPVVPPSVNQ